MTRQRFALWALLASAICLWPATAFAHPSGTTFRLGLGLPALSVTHFPSPDETTVTYGLYPITFGLHLGVQVTSEIGIAAHVYGGGQYVDTPGGEGDIVLFGFVPRFEYMFTPHGTVAPYLGGEIGGEWIGDPDIAFRDLFRTGGFFGLHIFAESAFSVDLEVAGNFVYDLDRDIAGFRAVFYVSVLGWLG